MANATFARIFELFEPGNINGIGIFKLGGIIGVGFICAAAATKS